MSSNKLRWVLIITASLLIHSIFCVHAVAAARARTRGMAADEVLFMAFLPHYMAIYFLPPK